jgi:hypothetical protein
MKTIEKTVKRSDDLYIDFTPEEMDELKIAPHDKFEVIVGKDNTITLKKFEKLDINLGDFERSTLEMLIEQSIAQQVPVDEIIRESIKAHLQTPPNEGSNLS